MSWLWHRLNRDPIQRQKQCYYNYHCVICWFRLILLNIKLMIWRTLR